jgi:2-phospho-L-lactate guanylyltransferase
MKTTAQALVPMKDLVQAKSRLAGLLRPAERRALAQAMVEDVLSVLCCHGNIARITILSDDPGAGLLARKYGAQVWPESMLGAHGLNSLVQAASERLLADGAQPLVVLHGDLPLLTAADISAVLSGQRDLQGLIIGCDRQGRGTNLLGFDAASMPRFCFGIDSCAAHVTSARDAGVPVEILHRAGISMDVDEAADLKCVMDQLHSNLTTNTAQLLHDTKLGSRVTLALAALSDDARLYDQANRGMAG